MRRAIQFTIVFIFAGAGAFALLAPVLFKGAEARKVGEAAFPVVVLVCGVAGFLIGAREPAATRDESSERTFRCRVHRLLAVLLLVAVCFLGAIVYFAMYSGLDRAEGVRATADLQNVATQCIQYAKVTGDLPTTEQGLQALVEQPATPPTPTAWRQFMSQLPLDPWNRPYGYRRLDSKAAKFELFSLGPDGSGSADDIRETFTF